MKKLLAIVFLLSVPALLSAQTTVLPWLEKIQDFKVSKKDNRGFREYYEIWVTQPLDHFDESKGKFQQRLSIGFMDRQQPVLFETEGYAIGSAGVPEVFKGCNFIAVEHRFFGKSIPAAMDWSCLTIKQAAYDLHRIRVLLAAAFPGKWIISGSSKGGQCALASRIYFPADSDMLIVNATPVRNHKDDPRIMQKLNRLLETPCGKKVVSYRNFCFRNKKMLLRELEMRRSNEGLEFTGLSTEVIFDYMLLEYPFSFFQSGRNCELIPDTSLSYEKILDEIYAVVPARFYSDLHRQRRAPAFHMFYKELGYYEYDIADISGWLSMASYQNKFLAPDTSISYDNSYHELLNRMMSDKREGKMIFIYGENDPYSGAAPVLVNTKDNLILMIKNGSHRSRSDDLDEIQKTILKNKVHEWIGW